jgi:hypothetical protein
MLKELFEGHFYGTFPKVGNRLLMLDEKVEEGDFSLLDTKACQYCRFVCNEAPDVREQLRVQSAGSVNIISMEQVFSYVRENVGETCDYMMEGAVDMMLVEMTCSTTDYVGDKRQKARRQLYNTLTQLFMSPAVRAHIENMTKRTVVFSWKETFDISVAPDIAESSMLGMTLMSDEVYSPDNESKFDFGFVLREIRYPDFLVVA